MADNKPITQPGEEAESELIDLIEDTSEKVWIGNREYTIKPLRKGTRLMVTSILRKSKKKSPKEDNPENRDEQKEQEELKLSDKEMAQENRVMAKCAAAFILNSFWTLRFMGGLVWKVYWRWLYYVRQYSDSDYYALVQLCKKKAEKQTTAYTMNIMLLTAMSSATMAMTREEVRRIHLEKSLEQLGAQQKSFQP